MFRIPDLHEELAADLNGYRRFVMKLLECDLACAAQHETRFLGRLSGGTHQMFDDERFLNRKDVFGTERSGTLVAQAYRVPANSILQTLVAFHRKPPIVRQFRG